MMRKGAGKFLALSFLLVFLFSQSASLVHAHGSDLKKHLDCELCLKVGSDDDGLVLEVSGPEFSRTLQHYEDLPVLAAIFRSTAAKSRSPPHSF